MLIPQGWPVFDRLRHIKGELLPYQAAALYTLAAEYDCVGANLLEIGTAAGYSAGILALAAHRARIVTLNRARHEIRTARANLKRAGIGNVRVVNAASWKWLSSYSGPRLDLIFVDGDHKQAARDVPWWDWLQPGGLMLFHDYSPDACPFVYATVNALAQRLDRELDVLVMDEQGIGMAGLRKKA